MTTLARKLGTTEHHSLLSRRTRGAGLHSAADLIGLAIVRGCHHYKSGPEVVPPVPVPREVFSDEELSIALFSPCLPYNPRTIRVGAQMLGSSNNQPRRLGLLASKERAENVVCHTSTRDRRTGQNRYLRRSGITIAALEFEHPPTNGGDLPTRQTWGIRVAYESTTAQPDFVRFFAPTRLEKDDFYVQQGDALEFLDEDEFKAGIRRHGGESHFTTNKAFIEEMGVPIRLNFDDEQMGKTLPKAIAFELEKDYESFIRSFILEFHPLDIVNAKQSLDALRQMAHRVDQLNEPRVTH